MWLFGRIKELERANRELKRANLEISRKMQESDLRSVQRSQMAGAKTFQKKKETVKAYQTVYRNWVVMDGLGDISMIGPVIFTRLYDEVKDD